MDAGAVEVGRDDASTNNSVVLVVKIFIVVSVVDIVCIEDDTDFSVVLEIISLVVVFI